MRLGWALVPIVVVALGPAACGNDYTLDTPGSDAGADVSNGPPLGDSGAIPTSFVDASSRDGAAISNPAPVDAGSRVFPPACDTTQPAVDCQGAAAPICGSELTGYAGPATDLIECGPDSKSTCIRHCTMGCVGLSSKNLPSTCANCTAGNVTRWYCGKNTSFPAADSDVVFECVNGSYVADSSAICGASFCHTTCTRTSPPPLPGSCCQSTPDN